MDLAHTIWLTLRKAHERNDKVKARLFETYHHEYKNFTHLPGESVDLMFQLFTMIVNLIKANTTSLPYYDLDRVLKLLHALHRNVSGTKVDTIIESTRYVTLGTV